MCVLRLGLAHHARAHPGGQARDTRRRETRGGGRAGAGAHYARSRVAPQGEARRRRERSEDGWKGETHAETERGGT